MSWRVAKSLLRLRDQINALAPKRSKSSDGTIGDAAHAKVPSEHNPDKNGVVRAMDITHDPANAIDAGKIARALAATRDPRILYLISNGQICSSTIRPWEWRPYSGKNPHDKHFHLSVVADAKLHDSDMPWRLDGYEAKADASAPKVVSRPLLKRGSKGDSVKVLQRLLTGLTVDGDFGPKTEAAVKEFQTKHKLVADGIVGQYTWAALAA